MTLSSPNEEKGFCHLEGERVFLVLRELAQYEEDGPISLETILADPDKYVILHEESLIEREENELKIRIGEPDRDPYEEVLQGRPKTVGKEDESKGPADILPLSMRKKLEDLSPVDGNDATDDRSLQNLDMTLSRYHREGLIVLEDGYVTVTDRGARVLARGLLKRIVGNFGGNLGRRHAAKALKEGMIPTATNRKYEEGDDYASLDFENTLLNALGHRKTDEKIRFRKEDFRVHEKKNETKSIAGLLVDTSMSMQLKNIMETARDTSLALAELFGEQENHTLKVYLFADHVKEVPSREIFRHSFPGGLTDICAPLEKFRKAVRSMDAEKQAYLITDSVSNLRNGRLLGFEEAAPHVLAEVSRYRKEKIVLNVVMLGEQERFKAFATKMAQRSNGRVFFVSSENMARTIVRNYARSF
ncbi:MAG: hypothetical protein JRF71_06230 [Deltaproteobacteria bacterium]|nr:hypothetical protein [Deltaproteobacteria bacterium]